MHLKKKGIILLETIIVVNIIMLLIFLYSKQGLLNLKKTKYFYFKDDIKTISTEEEELIIECVNSIVNNESLINIIIQDEGFENVKIDYKYSKDNNLYIQNEKDLVYLVYNTSYGKSLRLLEVDIDVESCEVSFIPSTYITSYIK